MDRKFAVGAFVHAIAGLRLGRYMAASKNHGQVVTHTRVTLRGFVVTFIYGVCHWLRLGNDTSLLTAVQFYTHQAGTIVLVAGLFFLFGKLVTPESIDPLLAVSSTVVLIGMLMTTVLILKSTRS
ncbi:MAG: TonB-dependent receptor [Proteobacteria bacterium]|nr:MAG: TonB-dependent receptor [Pseudomonadota bacterium]